MCHRAKYQTNEGWTASIGWSGCNLYPSRASLVIARQIKQANPRLRVGAAIWAQPSQSRAPSRTVAITQREFHTIGSDFVAGTIEEVLALTIADEASKACQRTASALDARRPRVLGKRLKDSGGPDRDRDHLWLGDQAAAALTLPSARMVSVASAFTSCCRMLCSILAISAWPRTLA